MKHRPLLVVLASVFCGMAMLLAIAALVTGTPLVLMAAVPLGLTGVLMWYHGTGRFLARMLSGGSNRRRHRPGRRASTGGATRRRANRGSHDRDGGRAAWETSIGGEARRAARTRARRQAQRRTRRHDGTGTTVGGSSTGATADGPGETAASGSGPSGTAGGGWRNHRPRADRLGGLTAAEAYDVLGLAPTADEDDVRDAYREKVKTAHPDTEGGSAEEFQELQEAYERLVDD